MLAQLKEMATLTLLSNQINEIQMKNMKMFPLVFFNGVKSVKIDYDLAHKKMSGDDPVENNSAVSYFLDIDETKDNGFLDKRFAHLEAAIRGLFWNDIKVEVYFNKRIVFKSVKNGQ